MSRSAAVRPRSPETPAVLLSTSEPFLPLAGSRRREPIGFRFVRKWLLCAPALPALLGLKSPEPSDREGNAAEIKGSERHQRQQREIGDRQQSRNNADKRHGHIFTRHAADCLA